MEMEAKGDRDWPSHMACQTGSPGFLALLLPSGSHPSTFLAFSPHLIKQVPTEGCTVRACLRDPKRPRKPCLNPSPPPASQESSHRGPFSHLGQQLRRAVRRHVCPGEGASASPITAQSRRPQWGKEGSCHTMSQPFKGELLGTLKWSSAGTENMDFGLSWAWVRIPTTSRLRDFRQSA